MIILLLRDSPLLGTYSPWGAPEEQSCAAGINGDQTNNSCGVIMVHMTGFPDPVPSRGGVGAVYVYALQ
jgi:hypothetical protein